MIPTSYRYAYHDQSSDTSCDEYGAAYTPRSTHSEYYRGGFGGGARHHSLAVGRGVSPSLSEPPISSRRAPSTDSFFGKNGANLVSGGANNGGSQIWYQRYKHSSFSNTQHTFGELPSYGAFDGRINNIRGMRLKSYLMA